MYTQTIIAMIWDFDRTLIPGYSQKPIFEEYGIDERKFWAEVNELPARYRERGLKVADDTAYLSHMLTYVRNGELKGLTNEKLVQLGSRIEMCPGIPEFLGFAKRFVQDDERFKSHGIEVEHYIVSTGIRHLIEGSSVGKEVVEIWANEFIDQPPPPGYMDGKFAFNIGQTEIAQVGYMIDNTSKTRAIFEINKGPKYSVNARVAEEDRRIPILNMIYIADGPSDIPVFSVVGSMGGRRLGVYQGQPRTNYEGVKQLEDESRVDSIAPADFREDTQAWLWLTSELRRIATRICNQRDAYLDKVKAPAGHVVS